jgi:4-amino-4-deoxy-L-arabinose transferase-like glycosyltransferase
MQPNSTYIYIFIAFIIAIGVDIWWVWGHQRYRMLRESAVIQGRNGGLIIDAFFPILRRIKFPNLITLKAFLTSQPIRKTTLLAFTIWLIWLSLRTLQNSKIGWQVSIAWVILIGAFVVLVIFDRAIRGINRFASGELQGGTSDQAEIKVQNWQWISLIASLFLAFVTTQAAGMGTKMANPPLAIFAWLSAIGLVVLGGISFLKKRISIPMDLVLPIILLGFLAFAIRAYDIGKIPNALSGDEGTFGLSAVAFIQGSFDNIFRSGVNSFPSMYGFILSLSVRLFGQTAEAIRLNSAFIGAVTVAALYPFTLKMFGKKTALFSSIFLVAFHYHIAYSRMALNNIWDGLWFVFVLGFLWKGWYSERRIYFVMAGIGLGLSQYFYASARLLIPLVPVWILLVGWMERRRLKRNLLGLLFMTLAAVVTVLPLAVFFIHFPNEYQAPLVRVSIFGRWMTAQVENTGLSPWQIMLKQFAISFEGLFVKPLLTFYEPGTPMLRLASAVLFVIGGAGLAHKIKEPRANLLFLWLFVFVITGAFSITIPASQRYVAVAPAAAILIGYGLSMLTEQMEQLWPKRARLIGILGIGLILLVDAGEMRFFFVEYKNNSSMGGFNTMVAQRLADYLKDKEDDWEVVFFGYPEMGYKTINSIPYLAPHIKGYTMNKPWGSDENPKPTSHRLIFVFLPFREDDLKRVKASYPNGILKEEYYFNGDLLYWLYEVET